MVESPTSETASASSTKTSPRPELLAPAGDWDCVKAAVENGADAIYFGLEKFNARIRAHNFTDADLPKLVAFLHWRGVKGYVTFNTLIFENEMAEAEEHLQAMIAAGVDAVLVQDVGLARLIRSLSPDFPIHASTQMTITSAAGVEFARELGCNRVVLARECSIADIKKIRANQDRAGSPSPAVSEANHGAHEAPRPGVLPLEVFVHGALCVAYSGQCLTSEALGGRSANRGECAQACRMPYELISDGKLVPLGDRKYLLSPQDLAGLEVLPALIQAGVSSLKIEGRLKTSGYVASITRIYRQALDKITAQTSHRDTETLRNISKSIPVSPSLRGEVEQYSMEMAFSRGLYTGWLGGINNQDLVHGRFGKKRGVFLGEVKNVRRDSVMVKLAGPLKPGDGVVFDAGRPEEQEEGGRVYEVRSAERSVNNLQIVELRFGRGDIDFSRVHVGDKLWKTSDPELERRLRLSFEGDTPRFQRTIKMTVHGQVAGPLTLIARDDAGHIAKLESSTPLTNADHQPLATGKLREQLGRLGGTPFKLGNLENKLTGKVVLPVSELNRLRREAVAELERQRAQPQRWMRHPDSAERANRVPSSRETGTRSTGPSRVELIVLVRNLAQLEATLKGGVETVYCDFENPKKYREAVTRFRESFGCAADCAHGTGRPTIWVAPPRIFKPGEEWMLNQVRAGDADGYLVRNYDHLTFFANDRCIGDFSLNIANRLAAEYFKRAFRLERVTASYDLNLQQLEALLQAAPPEWFEVTIHQHMPMFHMEHCVFCAFLTQGRDYRDCGRPCDAHDLKLRDRVGAEHPVKADVGCRNTVFHALAQTGAEYVERMRALGVRYFRVEFVNESPEQVLRTVTKYRQLLRGEISGSQLWRELKLFSQLGVTRGPMAGTRS